MSRSGRTAAVAKEMIGDRFTGVLVTDQHNGYHWMHPERRQLCWAHLIRHFRQLLDFGDQAKAFGQRCLDFAERMFHHWHRVRDGTISRSEFEKAMEPLPAELSLLLTEGRDSTDKHVRRLCNSLARHEQSLWTFVRRQAVHPTNNAAERALRPAVIWRKNCYGTDSGNGSRFVERILTVVGTLRIRGHNVLEYITEVCRCALLAQPTPALPLGG